jgi:potassium channel subfamily K
MSIAHVTGTLGARFAMEGNTQEMVARMDESMSTGGGHNEGGNGGGGGASDGTDGGAELTHFHPYVKVCTNATAQPANHRRSLKPQWQKTQYLEHTNHAPVWNATLSFDVDLTDLLDKRGEKELAIKFEAWHRDLAITSHDDHIGSGKFCIHFNKFTDQFKVRETVQLHNGRGVPSGTLQVIYTWKGMTAQGSEGGGGGGGGKREDGGEEEQVAAAAASITAGITPAGIATSPEHGGASGSPSASESLRRASSFKRLGRPRSLYAAGTAVNTALVVPRGTLTVQVVRAFHLLDPNNDATSMVDPRRNVRLLLYSSMLLVSYLSAGCLFFLLLEGPDSTFAKTPLVAATNSTPAVYPNIQFHTIMDVIYFSVCTFTTVGYGDVAPQTPAGRLFAVFYAIYGVVVVAVAINIMVSGVLKSSAAFVAFMRGACCESAITSLPAQRPLTRSDVNRTALGLLLKMLGVILFGSLVFMVPTMMEDGATEGLSFIDSLYMCTMTAASVGYGDISPQNQAGRTFLSVWLMGGYVIVAQSIVKISDLNQRLSQRNAEQSVLNRDVGVELLGMDVDQDGGVDLYEFMTHMAVAMGKMRRHEIAEIKTRFEALDKTGDGMLTREDFAEFKGSLGAEEA